MQTSAMKACFQIAECSLSYTKINIKVDFCKDFKLNFIFCVIGAIAVLWIWKKLFD